MKKLVIACMVVMAMATGCRTQPSGEHIVKSGDMLGRIARSYGLSTEEIMKLNPGLVPQKLVIGQRIRIGTAKRVETAPVVQATSTNASVMQASDTNKVMPRREVVVFPELGAAVVESHFNQPFDYPDDSRNNIKRPYLSLSSTNGQELCRIQFLESEDYWENRPLNFAVVSIPQHSTPFIVAVAVQPGGSDHSFESTIVGAVKGKLCDLMPEHPHSNIQGAFCVGNFGKELSPGALSLNFIWDDGVHYQAHRYECTVYEWNGTEFRKKSVLETKQAYESWKDAAKELGFSCETDLREMLLPEYR